MKKLLIVCVWVCCLGLLPSILYAQEDNVLLDRSFMFSASAEDVDAAIKAGANIEDRDKIGWTPLHIAINSCGLCAGSEIDNFLNMEGLQSWDEKEEDNHLRVASKVAVLEVLLKHEADIEARSKNGYTPLHIALLHFTPLEMVKLLLNHGANPEARHSTSSFDRTALHIAVAHRRNPKVIMALLDNGADIEAKDNFLGETPLYQAVAPAVVRVLLERGADIHARDGIGQTPLHNAAEENYEKVKLLLEYGADIEARNLAGRTPLHVAARVYSRSNKEEIEVLLKHGANVDVRDVLGRSPLHDAVRFSKSPSLVELLLDHGGDPTAQDKWGRTPFDYIQNEKVFINTKAYWLLNEAQYR
ncbi:MAG: ankyrin repeat domain-containing protein [Parvularculales bacterium]